jgi:alcohol dehydrogenase class IV
MMHWEYRQPVRIVFGNGVIHQLAEEIKSLGGNNGILITSSSFERRGDADIICKISENRIKHLFSHVTANPTVKECDVCMAIMKKEHCDFVVAMGGGSVMDLAKAAATFCLTDNSSADYLATGKSIPAEHLPVIAVPTTAGTGSEITCVAVLSDHERGMKSPINSNGFYPLVAIVDPELTYTVPPYMTACTGFDVICHAIEAYWSKYHQPICDALAVHSAKLAMDNLEKAYNHPDDKDARSNMAEASVMAGLAFTMPKTTSAHACSYPLTNLLGIPHGEACALTITWFIRFNARKGCQRIDALAQLLGYQNYEALADTLDDMRRRLGLRMNLKEFNLDKQQFEQLVEGSKHPNLKNNPIEVTEKDLRKLYQELE